MDKTFNLFANIDDFSSNYNNCSFEIEHNNSDVIEITEDINSQQGRKRKKNSKEVVVCKTESLMLTDNVIVPGIGQKGAFEKLKKLKKNLQSITASSPKKRTKSKGSAAISTTYKGLRSGKKFQSPEFVKSNNVESGPHYDVSKQGGINSVNQSFDADEFNVYIKLKWEGTSKVEKIEFKMHKKFQELITELSNREKIDTKLLLMCASKVINPNDTPHSIGYTLGKFISVRIVDDPTFNIPNPKSYNHKNTLEIKIQSSEWRKPIICNIKKTDTFKDLCAICSEELKCPPEKLRFKFDGDLVEMSSTPNDLDFEGGEILDLIILI